MLEREGLTLTDVDLKIFPFTQMGIALKNKAIDAALADPAVHLAARGAGASRSRSPSVDELVQPQPMTIAVIMANTDWVKANPDLVQRYMTAWLRGAREYCQAYHGASNRQEIIDELVNTKTDAEPGAAGEVSVAGAQPERQDQRREHARHQHVVRDEQDVDASNSRPSAWSIRATSTTPSSKLGPFELQNKDSKLPGCR